jgi:hypothetical protein
VLRGEEMSRGRRGRREEDQMTAVVMEMMEIGSGEGVSLDGILRDIQTKRIGNTLHPGWQEDLFDGLISSINEHESRGGLSQRMGGVNVVVMRLIKILIHLSGGDVGLVDCELSL